MNEDGYSNANQDGDLEVVRVITEERRIGMTEAIRQRGRRYADIVDLLFFDWPKAKDVIENLRSYVSEHIQRHDDPVIYTIVTEALDEYHEAVYNPGGRKLEDPLRLAVFINALVTATCRELQIVITNDAGQSWSLASGTPFATWLTANDGELTIYSQAPADESSLREVIYSLLTSESVKRILKRAGHEDAVLANRVVTDR